MTRRLEAARVDLNTVAPAERQPALDHQLRLLAHAASRGLDSDDDRDAALVPDAHGLASGADVTVS